MCRSGADASTKSPGFGSPPCQPKANLPATTGDERRALKTAGAAKSLRRHIMEEGQAPGKADGWVCRKDIRLLDSPARLRAFSRQQAFSQAKGNRAHPERARGGNPFCGQRLLPSVPFKDLTATGGCSGSLRRLRPLGGEFEPLSVVGDPEISIYRHRARGSQPMGWGDRNSRGQTHR